MSNGGKEGKRGVERGGGDVEGIRPGVWRGSEAGWGACIGI